MPYQVPPPAPRKHPKEFSCLQCGRNFPNRQSVAFKKYCSPACYHASPSFQRAILNGGKAHKGMSHNNGANISAAKIGKPRPDMRGPRNPNWKGGVDLGRRNYDPKHINWRREVFHRDAWTCQKCGAKNFRGRGSTVRLEADHIEPWAKSVDLRYEVANGRTLCRPCHVIRHSK